MNNEPKEKNQSPSSNYREPQPEGKIPEGDKVVKQPEDEVYTGEPATAKSNSPAATKEKSEQPVNPVKQPANGQDHKTQPD